MPTLFFSELLSTLTKTDDSVDLDEWFPQSTVVLSLPEVDGSAQAVVSSSVINTAASAVQLSSAQITRIALLLATESSQISSPRISDVQLVTAAFRDSIDQIKALTAIITIACDLQHSHHERCRLWLQNRFASNEDFIESVWSEITSIQQSDLRQQLVCCFRFLFFQSLCTSFFFSGLTSSSASVLRSHILNCYPS